MIGVQKTAEELYREMEVCFQKGMKEKKGKKNVRKQIAEKWEHIQRAVAQMQGTIEGMKLTFAHERENFERDHGAEFPDVYARSLEERLRAQEKQVLKRMEEMQEEFTHFLASQ